LDYKKIAIAVCIVAALVGVGWAAFGLIFGGDAELGLIDFGDDPVEEYDYSSSASNVASELDAFYEIPDQVLIEVDYMFAHQIYLALLVRLNQDLLTLTSYKSESEVDLDWVIDVHDATLEAEEVFALLADVPLPGTNREQYLRYKLGMLESLQISAEGATRLLAASILIGPSGRGLPNLSVDERVQFDGLLRQAAFYFDQADTYLEEEQEVVSSAVSTISLR